MMSYVNTVSIVSNEYSNALNGKGIISRSCSPVINDISESPTSTSNGTTYIRVYTTDGKKKNMKFHIFKLNKDIVRYQDLYCICNSKI